MTLSSSNGGLIGFDDGSPYQITWTPQVVGNYSLVWTAIDNNGGQHKVSAQVSVAASFKVSTSVPWDFPPEPGLPATFTAETQNAQGGVNRVVFTLDGVDYVDMLAPFELPWTTVGGRHSLSLTAFDNAGNTATHSMLFYVLGPPRALIGKPLDGETFNLTGGRIAVKASAWTDPESTATVESLAVFVDGILVAADPSAEPPLDPGTLVFQGLWTPTGAGTHVVTATATDSRGSTGHSEPVSFNVLSPNAAPSLAWVAPSASVRHAPASDVVLVVSAEDDNDEIVEVSFAVDGQAIGDATRDSNGQYSLTWQAQPSGSRSVTATATDSEGASESATRTIVVNSAPTVAMNISNGTVVDAGQSLSIEAAATDDVATAKVQFQYQGAWSEDNSAPYTFVISSVGAGQHTITARAVDDEGLTGPASTVTFVGNAAPQVDIDIPDDGASYAHGAAIPILVNTSDDGSVVRVDLFDGASLLTTLVAPESPDASPHHWSWNGAALGEHRLKAEATDNHGRKTVSAEIEITVLDDADPEPPTSALNSLPSQPSVAPSVLPLHDPTVGATAGTPAVSGGAATYEIPIVVPPGRRGMQPQLALSYSSRNGNGVAGMGWSLSGLSSLHRCPRTLAQDNYVRAVRLDGEDAICLDGQRLVAVAGPGYGQAGAEYRTESESFQKIVQHGGSLASSSTWFEVIAKSGQRSVYGRGPRGEAGLAEDAAVHPRAASGGTPSVAALSWLLAYTEDTVGNSMSYGYDEFGSGEVLLASVAYTGFRGEQATREVAFEYGDGNAESEAGAARPDVSTSYLSGYRTQQTQLLERIVTRYDGDDVRKYNLTYFVPESGRLQRSLLESVEECGYRDGATAACRRPTEFTWQRADRPAYAFDEEANVNAAGQLHEYLGDFRNSVRLLAFADINGDGSRDILWQGPAEAAAADEPVETISKILTLSPDHTLQSSIDVTELLDGERLYTTADYLARSDFDMDGRPELVGVQEVGGVDFITLNFWRDLPSGAPPPQASIAQTFSERWLTDIAVGPGTASIGYVGDIDGRGGAEFLMQSWVDCPGGKQWNFTVLTLGSESGSQVQPDGILVRSKTFVPIASYHGVCGNGLTLGQSLERVADFDGDGLADLWITDDKHSERMGIVFGHYLKPGSSGTACNASNAGTAGPEGRFCLGNLVQRSELLADGATPLTAGEEDAHLLSFWIDVNADGLDDWLHPELVGTDAGEWALRLNTGGRFGSLVRFQAEGENLGLESGRPDDQNRIWQPWRVDRIQAMDYDSDGSLDLLVPESYASRICTLRWESPDEPCVGDDLQTEHVTPGTGDETLYPDIFVGGLNPDATQECRRTVYCPEPMGAGAGEIEGGNVPHIARIVLRDRCGNVPPPDNGGEEPPVDEECGTPVHTSGVLKGLYETGGATDHSAYNMSALRFVEAADGSIQMHVDDSTGIIVGHSSPSAGDDIYGDGLPDILTKVSCYEPRLNPDNPNGCGVPREYGNFVLQSDGSMQWVSAGEFEQVSHELPGRNGPLPVMTPKVLINENLGVPIGDIPEPSYSMPPDSPDLLMQVEDGLGNTVQWVYKPLGYRAGRAEGDLPLYRISEDGDRYADAEHIYFTSSMLVVDSMQTSTATQLGWREYRYGYTEAMYNIEGRGFQGFRSITEEDGEAGLRTTSTFHQKFPRTGKLERIRVEALADDGLQTFPVSEELYAWSCDPASLTDYAGCEAVADGASRAFPYLARKHSRTFMADGSPLPFESAVPSSERFEIVGQVEREAFCDTGAANLLAAGLDAHGNVTYRSSVTFDRGSEGTGGAYCEHEEATFAAPSTGGGGHAGWWIDKLLRSASTRTVDYSSLPAGVDADELFGTRAIETTYEWNPDRTLASSTVAALPADLLQRVRKSVPEYSVYGLPELTITEFNELPPDAVEPSPATRTESVAYSDDGYFPVLQTNAEGHVTQGEANPRDGQPEQSIDPNGILTEFDYDAFGFLVQTRSGKEGAAVLVHPRHVARQWAEVSDYAWNDHACPGVESEGKYGEGSSETVFVTIGVQGGTPKSVTCHDPFGRVVLEIALVAEGIEGEWFSKVWTRYNKLGKVAAVSEPYGRNSADFYTRFPEYDFLARPLGKYVEKVDEAYPNDDGDLLTTYLHEGRTTSIEVCGYDPSLGAVIGTPAGDDNDCLQMSRVQDSFGRFVETNDAFEPSGRTRFWHDANGSVALIQDAKGVLTKALYNAFGHRTDIWDPNQGHWQFTHNGLGEVARQTDARLDPSDANKKFLTQWARDRLGRVTDRWTSPHDADGSGQMLRTHDSFVWDSASGASIGLLASQVRDYVDPNTGETIRSERSESYAYDDLARRTAATVTQLWRGVPTTLHLAWAYDTANGWLLGRQWDNREVLRYEYSNEGWLVGVVNGADPAERYWATSSWQRDARGTPLQEELGGWDRILLERKTSYATGQVGKIEYWIVGDQAPSLRLDYSYDLFGNLETQVLGQVDDNVSTPDVDESSFVAREQFNYDELHRLVKAERDGQAAVHYGYDAVGNVLQKSDFGVGNYIYGGTGSGGGPNAVSRVPLASGNRDYFYDPNGNMVGDSGGFASKYDAGNLPVRLTRNGTTLSFGYGADGMRGRQDGPGPSQERLYVQGYEQTPRERIYPIGDFGQIRRSSDGERKVEFFAKDRLGSVVGVFQSSLAEDDEPVFSLAELRAFDAFGKPRQGDWVDMPEGDATLPPLGATPKGFTSHEHLDVVRLIHMNGRAYDFALGRFLSVDPYVQSPLNSQAINPYSYLLNNPFSGTDPTGYVRECGPDGPSEGSVCELRSDTEGDQRSASLSGKRGMSITVTVANNGGVYHLAYGSGRGAHKEIEKSIAGIGSAVGRPSGATMQATPMKVREEKSAACLRFFMCNDDPAHLEDPSNPSWFSKSLGDWAGAWIGPDESGVSTNPFTGDVVSNPYARLESFLAVATMFLPTPKTPVFQKPGAASVDDLLEMMNRRANTKAEYADGDMLRYLQAQSAEGSHALLEGGGSHIVLKPGASRYTVMHEWLHRRLQRQLGRPRPGEENIIDSFLRRHKQFFRLDDAE